MDCIKLLPLHPHPTPQIPYVSAAPEAYIVS